MDYLGYAASLIVLISLLMSSIKKLRWINLAGALLFGIYGFMIQSLPTGFMNLGIVIIDIYYLVKMYKSKDFFRVLPITEDKEYLNSFIDFYKEDIGKYVNLDKISFDKAVVKFYILRNMNPAGVFVCNKYNDNTLEISLDYVIPQFRDFKMGDFVFKSQREYFLENGYDKLVVNTENLDHIKYVKRMGFALDETQRANSYVLKLK
jgi:hypothetical protein